MTKIVCACETFYSLVEGVTLVAPRMLIAMRSLCFTNSARIISWDKALAITSSGCMDHRLCVVSWMNTLRREHPKVSSVSAWCILVALKVA